MLHWHPWWLHTTDGSSRTPTDPAVALPEPALWDPEQWLESQAQFWDRCLESNRAFWKTCAGSLPVVHWPDPPVVVPPQPVDAAGDAAGRDETDEAGGIDAERAAELRKRLRGMRWRHHEASGATRARIERLRKR